MSIVTGVNHLNRVLARSYIAQFNNSSAVDHRSSVSIVSNLNSHITSSIITNNYNNSTITIINNLNVRNNLSLLDIKAEYSVVGSVVVITGILHNNRF